MQTSKAITTRELEILALIGEGLASKEVGQRLFVTKRTIDFHLSNIYRKLNVQNRLMALRAIREDVSLIHPAPLRTTLSST